MSVKPDRIDIGVLKKRIVAAIGKNVSVSDSPLEIYGEELNDADKRIIHEITKRIDVLDQWDSEKLRSLTLADVNQAFDNLDAAISAASTVAALRTQMLNLSKRTRQIDKVTLWLLKREQNEL